MDGVLPSNLSWLPSQETSSKIWLIWSWQKWVADGSFCLDRLKFPKHCTVKLCREVITWTEICIPIMILKKKKNINSQFKLNEGVTKMRTSIYELFFGFIALTTFVLFSSRVIWRSLATWRHCAAVPTSLWCLPPKLWRGCKGRWGWMRLDCWISPPWMPWNSLAVGFLMWPTMQHLKETLNGTITMSLIGE